MDENLMIRFIKYIVEERCKSRNNVFGYEIWTHHITFVVKYSKSLAEILGADKEIVELAALLHDYAGIIDKAMYKDHHIFGAIEAEKLLNGFEYPEDKIAKVKECILQHRGSIESVKSTKESICIASADAMAHIDQMPSLLHLAYCKKNMSVNEGATWVLNKLQRSYYKLCPEAKALINEKYESSIRILMKEYEVAI